MKKLLVILCLFMVLVIGGCATTSSATSSSQVDSGISDEEIERQREAALIAYNELLAQREEREAIAEAQRQQQEAERLQREAERNAPRFSPEGNEYLKRTLVQAVGEANNPSNRGRTLFFETRVSVKAGGTVGQWFVSELGSRSEIIMYFYGAEDLRMLSLPIVYYRVEIDRFGLIRYTIDSVRQPLF